MDRDYFKGFFLSEGSPSLRLVCGLLAVLVALGLEVAFASAGHAKEFVDSNFLFAASLFGIGSARMVATAYIARPPEPAAQIRADNLNATVQTDNINVSEPTS